MYILNDAEQRMFLEWETESEKYLVESIRRQSTGLTTCLQALLLASHLEQSSRNLRILHNLLRLSHQTLLRFSNVVLNYRRKFSVDGWERTSLYQKINIYAIELWDMTDDFVNLHDYFLHARKILVVFLRIVYKTRVKIESYLVDVDFWTKYDNK